MSNSFTSVQVKDIINASYRCMKKSDTYDAFAICVDKIVTDNSVDSGEDAPVDASPDILAKIDGAVSGAVNNATQAVGNAAQNVANAAQNLIKKK